MLIQDLPAVTIGFNLGADLYHQMDLESRGKHQPLEESFHDGTDCTSLDVQRKERYSPARKCKIQEINVVPDDNRRFTVNSLFNSPFHSNTLGI